MWFNALKVKIDYLKKYATLMTGCYTLWNVYFVFNSSDAWYDEFQKLANVTYEDWTYPVHTSLSSAISACTTNRNDVVLIDANSTHSLTAWLAITKSRIHFIGMDWWNRLIQQWTKIQLATAATTAYVVKNTWTRNTFENIKFIQWATAGTWLYWFQDWWEWTVFKNCSFVFWVANNLWWTTAHEFMAGTDSWTFINCTFWTETLLTSWARSVFDIDQVTAWQEFKSNYFENCRFMISSTSWTATFIRCNAITDLLYTNEFKNTSFLASVDSAWWIALAEAVQTWTGTNKWTLLFTWTLSAMNCTKVSTATGWRNDAIQIVAPASSATGWIWVKPTA